MSDRKGNQSTGTEKSSERVPYETPAIIYEGLITTRADVSDGGGQAPSDVDSQANPADIFGSD